MIIFSNFEFKIYLIIFW